ncbi:MAG: FAD-dependent oxidoreductase [Chloroflexi bacterium]|nr:FAD-dependent oxidoreductase [Chloroflexota bacterium]
MAARVAIVGAGMAGLAAARRLRGRFEVVVYERAADVGGRATSRTERGAVFDPGAQYAKAPTAELERLLTEELGHETLVDIARPVWTFDGGGRIEPGDPALDSGAKWTYSDGLIRLGRELARGTDVRLGTSVAPEQLEADAVLVTAPESSGVNYRACISFAFGYRDELPGGEWYALVNTDRAHPISWLAYERLKPGRPMGGQQVVLAQMAPGWSAERLNQAGDVPAQEAAELAARLLGTRLEPVWADRTDWRYALPDGRAPAEQLDEPERGLFHAGDFTAGQGRIHLAIQEGWRAAAAIEAHLG